MYPCYVFHVYVYADLNQTTTATKPRIRRTVLAAAPVEEASFLGTAASRAQVVGATTHKIRCVP
jgi:hypothetical protein